MRIDVENLTDVKLKMAAAEKAVKESIEDDQEEFTDDLLGKLKKTSPVDTGQYKNAWEMAKERGKKSKFVIKNNAPHAKYLVYPNERMVGAEGADKPSRGILHNARGIIFRHRDEYVKKMATAIKKVLG